MRAYPGDNDLMKMHHVRRPIYIGSAAIGLFVAGYYLHAFVGRAKIPPPEKLLWHPSPVEVKPRWSIDVKEETRWAGVAENGDSVFWVEAKGRGGDAWLHHLVRGDPGRFQPIVIERVSQCIAGSVREDVVAVGLHHPIDQREGGSFSLAIIDVRRRRHIARVPFDASVETVHLLSSNQVLVGYQRSGWSTTGPHKVCLVEVSDSKPIRTELADNMAFRARHDPEMIGGRIYIGAAVDGSRIGISTWEDPKRVLEIWTTSPLKKLASITGSSSEASQEYSPVFTPDGNSVFWGSRLYHIDDDAKITSEEIVNTACGATSSRFLIPYGVVGYSNSGFGDCGLAVPGRRPFQLPVKSPDGWVFQQEFSTDGAFIATVTVERNRRLVDVWKTSDFIAKPVQ